MSNELLDSNYQIITQKLSNMEEIRSNINQKNNIKNVNEKSFKNQLNTALNQNQSINSSQTSKNEKKLYNSCVEMESFLWKMMLNSMKKTIDQYKIIDGGQAEDYFKDFLYDEYANMLAKNANSKIADMIYQQLEQNL